ncbi:MAG: hypothetical protein Q8R55_00370 [Candidatus Taylorbacteria bacterium]|nr:hypothetical protein [Candidatus Taylorbacteria bacterium]
MAIIISQNGKNAKRVERSQIEKEGYLQQYILDNPESIPLYDIKEDVRLLILIRELHTRNGPIDALGIDKEGNIYLIETKLFKNNDRRDVVAQVLDYGAALWSEGIDYNEFIRRIEEAVRKNFGVSLQERLKSFFEIEDEEVATLLESISQNLNKGIFRFVVLMDKLHDQLKDVILFLNENSRFDIYAVEIEYYKHENSEIMIPKLFGAEVKKDIAIGSSSARRRQTEEMVLEEAKQKLNDQEYTWFKQIFDFSKANADKINLGTGSYGTFSPVFRKLSSKSLYTVGTDKRLSFNFEWVFKDSPKMGEAFKRNLEEIGFRFSEDYKEKRPTALAEEWGSKTEEFIRVIQKLLEQ